MGIVEGWQCLASDFSVETKFRFALLALWVKHVVDGAVINVLKKIVFEGIFRAVMS